MRVGLVVPALMVMAVAVRAQPASPVADAGDPVRGFKLFVSDGCAECHGSVGQGGPGLRLAPAPMPASAIAAYIRDPAGEMPPYASTVVSDADIRDIHAYLAGIPKPPPVSAIPDLN